MIYYLYSWNIHKQSCQLWINELYQLYQQTKKKYIAMYIKQNKFNYTAFYMKRTTSLMPVEFSPKYFVQPLKVTPEPHN